MPPPQTLPPRTLSCMWREERLSLSVSLCLSPFVFCYSNGWGRTLWRICGKPSTESCPYFSSGSELFSFCLLSFLPSQKPTHAHIHTHKHIHAHSNVRLVVIDSMAALFRIEFGTNDAVDKSKTLSSFAHRLKELSDEFHSPVVCVNQVSRERERERGRGSKSKTLSSFAHRLKELSDEFHSPVVCVNQVSSERK
jgi:hypothetical protein